MGENGEIIKCADVRNLLFHIHISTYELIKQQKVIVPRNSFKRGVSNRVFSHPTK